jgi:poly-gamma-glutamate synthesis protein (capsule biosynthesis protein)
MKHRIKSMEGHMENESNESLVFYAAGDVAPYREDPASIFQHVKDILNRGDIVFCQFEINLSKRGTRFPQARLTVRADSITARAVKEAGFHVVSFASNHCMDWGPDAFFDTIDALKNQGLFVIGVGKNIEEARKPAIIECQGTRIAFLAYNSILPIGYWAEIDRPGCVPMRAWTIYEQIEHDQPGTPCRIHTFPHRGDLKAMIDDIRGVRSQADVVMVSIHWGIHLVPASIADYQREVAHIAIDSGADLIIGHHSHILKGVEVYKGKVIFYGLCNFGLDLPFDKKFIESPRFKETQALYPNWTIDPEYPTYGFPSDSRKTVLVKCILSNKSIKKVSFLPAYVNKQSQPEILNSQDERFGEVVRYMEEISRNQGLDTQYVVEGDEVLIQI